jgi:hypothetical protein
MDLFMADDLNTIHAAITGVIGAAVTFFGFTGKRFIEKVDRTDEKMIQHEKDDMGKYATVDQLARVHERIDASVRNAEDNFREMRQGIGEIKTILINGVHR